ncbi:MAG: hypothetical protein JNK67_27025 [Alphaproteobacteria bacterium]|nr:hypothetical protein [Alphaproteobacteria bacterium]
MNARTILAAALVLAPLAAFAHSASVGVNGGSQVDAGHFHVEMVARATTMTFYIRDHADKPVATDGFKGTAIFILDGKSQRIPLVPAGENRLSGTAPAALPDKPRGAVQITTPSGATVQGRFN